MSLLTDLVSHWKLNEASGTRADSHGSNDLTDNNTVTSATGKIGDAGDFEADNTEYLTRADNSSLSLGADVDFTIAAWVNPETVVGGVVDKRTNNTTGIEYSLAFNGGLARLSIGNGSTNTFVEGGSFSAGTWYFLVAWHSSADNKIYIQIDNGTPVEAAWTGGTQDTTAELRIGRAANNYFDGLIDSVSFWKRVLTSDERTSLYNSGNGLDYPFSVAASSLIYRPNRFQHLLAR